MNRKVSVIIIVLILVVGFAYFILPLLRNTEEELPAAEIALDGNLATVYGKQTPLSFNVHSSEINKIELIYNDSVYAVWEKPAPGKLKFLLETDYYGVGAYALLIRSYLKDGNVETDERKVRVLSDISPSPMKVSILKSYPHERTSYTQGLEFNDGQLYEGTGNPQSGEAASIVGKVDLETGKIETKNGLDASYFGEGITILGNELFQLTWKNGKCFVYDKNDLTLKLKEFTYQGEGWGLCNDGKYIIMSDGTERITFRDPKTFNIVRTIEVYTNIGPVSAINELEYIDGKIYANIYTSTDMIAIEPESGRVLEVIDGSGLVAEGKMGGDVLNGIAHNPLTKKTYMTGKYWGKLMEVAIIPF